MWLSLRYLDSNEWVWLGSVNFNTLCQVMWELWIACFIEVWHLLTFVFCLRSCLYALGHFIMRYINLLFSSSLASFRVFLFHFVWTFWLMSGWHMQQFFNFTMYLTKLYTSWWFGNRPLNVCFSTQQSSLYGKLSLLVNKFRKYCHCTNACLINWA